MDAVGVDVEELLELGNEIREWGQHAGIESRKPFEFFECLLEETARYVENGVDIEEAKFTAIELNELVKGAKGKENSPDVARRYVSDNVRKYQELITENKESLDSFLRDHSKRHELVIESTESKGGHKSYYYLGLRSIDAEQEIDSPAIDPKLVQYRVRQLPKFLPWAKPFAELTLVGWRRQLFVWGLVVMFVTPMLVALFILATGQLFMWQIILGGGAMMGLWLMKPLYDLIDTGVVEAPNWMLGFSDVNVQLELREEGSDDDSPPIRQIRLVKYEGRCSVCGGQLAVVRGTGEFRGRMIGQCSKSRTEHLYSFDAVTKLGVPLRENAYYEPRK